MKHTLTALVAGLFLVGAGRADEAKDGWVKLFDGKTLKGWKTFPSGTGKWKVEDGAIVGTGPASHLFTDKEFTDLHLRAEVKINDGGNSGMYFRTKFMDKWPDGYEAQINSTHDDPVKTGSLYNRVIVKDKLVKPDEWFTYEVIAKGNHITIKVNGKTTAEYEDKKETFKKGHVAFQQHHEGSEVRIRKVEVKDLSKP
jgi:hypothetical protein